MGYTESLLADGEVIARRDHQHWLALILDSRTALGVWLLAIVLIASVPLFNIRQGTIERDVLSWGAVLLLVIGLVLFAYRWLKWRNEDYVVTNRRIIKVTGIVNKRSADSSLEKINDLVLEENLIGRMLGYGDLDIITAADTAIDRFRMLRNAKEFKRVMLDQKHEFEQGGDFYRPSPPLMASSPASSGNAPAADRSEDASSAGAGAAPSAGSATMTTSAKDDRSESLEPVPVMSGSGSATDEAPRPSMAAPAAAKGSEDGSRDVTRTLARLADLRDRGAISGEEYEAKKAELLGRL